jgi:hypothetical protein
MHDWKLDPEALPQVTAEQGREIDALRKAVRHPSIEAPGPTHQLSNRLLDKFPGDTIFSWIS